MATSVNGGSTMTTLAPLAGLHCVHRSAVKPTAAIPSSTSPVIVTRVDVACPSPNVAASTPTSTTSAWRGRRMAPKVAATTNGTARMAMSTRGPITATAASTTPAMTARW